MSIAIFHNIDMLVYIASYFDDNILLPFALTCKSCLEATIASHRDFHTSSMSYFCRHVEMVKWIMDLDTKLRSSSSKVMHYAVRNGALDVIKWLHNEQYFPLDNKTCASASLNGHLHVLQWL